MVNVFNKYKSLTTEKKSIIWYTFCNIFQKGIAFLTVPIITRFLTVEEYGIYSLFLSWRDILMIFATLNLYCGVSTKIIVDNGNEQDKCISNLQSLGFIATIIFTVIYLLFRAPINELIEYETPIILAMITFFFFYPPFSLWCTKQRVNNKYVLMVIVTIILSILTPATSIILLYTTNLRQDAVIYGSVIAYAVAGLIFFVLNYVKGKSFFSKKYWSFALKYNIPLLPHYLSLFFLSQSDKLMIEYYDGKENVGIYSLAYQISMLMNIIFNAINNSFIPRSFFLLKEKNTGSLRKESSELIYFGLVLTIFAVLVSPEFVLIMGGKEYIQAIYIIPPVCFSTLIMFMYGFYSNVEFYHSKTKGIMFVSLIGAASNLFLNWIFIREYGYLAAGYTTVASYTIMLFLHYFLSNRIEKKEYGHSVFLFIHLIVPLLIICVSTAISLLLYQYWIIRYCVIAVALILMIIFRKKIISVIKMDKKGEEIYDKNNSHCSDETEQ